MISTDALFWIIFVIGCCYLFYQGYKINKRLNELEKSLEESSKMLDECDKELKEAMK